MNEVSVSSGNWPPSAWSLRLASKIAWYSAVSGAPSLPRGLVGSHWLLTPGGRRHWPFQSGYFDSSCACALASEKTIAAPRSEPKLQRDNITFSPRNIILTLNPIVVVIAGLTRQSIPLPYLPPLAGGRQGRGWPHGQAGG